MYMNLHLVWKIAGQFLWSTILISMLVSGVALAQPGAVKPLVRVVDLDVGETQTVVLCDGSSVRVKLVELNETRDDVCFAVRRAEVLVEVDGQTTSLVSGNYNLPRLVGNVKIDCSITQGNNSNGDVKFWGLDKDARLRLWPANSPLINPGTFVYPVKQKWFATNTQMANEPVFVDGGERPGKRSIYYHSGLDIGGSEGLVEIVAATEGLVVSVAGQVLEGHKLDTPVAPRYDVVYLLDSRGWYYRYSHMKSIDAQVVLGRVLKQGDRIGILGKEGGSGGWTHLHFEIKARQPSGKWGTEEGYAYLWEAYTNQYRPPVVAVARPHHLIWSGQSVTLDGSKSWQRSAVQLDYQWQFTDGTTASQAKVTRTYPKPGKYSEILRVTDRNGNTAFDFAHVYVYDRQNQDRRVPSIHANYFPTQQLIPGDAITFKVRTFGTTHGKEIWDFGDGSPVREVQSDGNVVALALNGYAEVKHAYNKPGDYIAKVQRTDQFGVTAITHLHVRVDEQPDKSQVRTGNEAGSGKDPWSIIGPHFSPPANWQGQFGEYRSPLKFDDGTTVTTADEWSKRRQEILEYWEGKLGKWPDLITEPKVEVLESVRRENFQQLKIRFLWTQQEYTTGYLLIPDGEGRRPAVVTVYYEPETAIGLKTPNRDFALQLARRGFVALSIGTTDATKEQTFSLYHPSLSAATIEPLSMLGYAAANAWYVLASRPEVDSQRIGIVGHSFGGKWAMFASCLFDRFACAAWSDPGIVFDDQRSNINYWEPWYLGYHPKPWRQRGLITPTNPARGAYPKLRAEGRDLHELHVLMAPRPFLVSGGAEDPVQRWIPLNHSIQVNQLLGHSNRVAMTNRPEHAPNDESNGQIYAFFEHFLHQR